MFFARRRMATRVLGRAGIPIRSPEATWLIDAMIYGAKNNSFRAFHSKADMVLITALSMSGNTTALSGMARLTDLPLSLCMSLLQQVGEAAEAIAREEGKARMIEVHRAASESD